MPERGQLIANQLGRKRTAAARINAQHHRLDALVAHRFLNQALHGLRTYVTRWLSPFGDRSAGNDNTHAVGTGLPLALKARVRLKADLAEMLLLGRCAAPRQLGAQRSEERRVGKARRA